MPGIPAFDKAATDVKKLTENPTNEEKLQLYGLYKVAHSEKFSTAKQPGTFDFAGKAKYASWKKLHEEGVKPEEAQKRYIALVEQLKPKYKYDASKKV